MENLPLRDSLGTHSHHGRSPLARHRNALAEAANTHSSSAGTCSGPKLLFWAVWPAPLRQSAASEAFQSPRFSELPHVMAPAESNSSRKSWSSTNPLRFDGLVVAACIPQDTTFGQQKRTCCNPSPAASASPAGSAACAGMGKHGRLLINATLCPGSHWRYAVHPHTPAQRRAAKALPTWRCRVVRTRP